MKTNLKRLLESEFTANQRALVKAHGTPADFALAVYRAVPGDISMDEAEAAISKYGREWEIAGRKRTP